MGSSLSSWPSAVSSSGASGAVKHMRETVSDIDLLATLSKICLSYIMQQEPAVVTEWSKTPIFQIQKENKVA